MGVLLQAAYRRSAGRSVPSPIDGDGSVPWWWDRLASQAKALRLCGFSAVLLPPVLKSSAGASPGADGYGTFDDYDIGSKNQFSVPTRFGTREQLQRCIAVMRANGLDVYVDAVLHQRDGGIDGVYDYLGADGVARNGRFPKRHGCFVGDPAQGYVWRDPLPGPVEDDFAFGDELAPINAVPKHYVRDGLVDAGDWLTRTLGVQGYRIDDVKGLAVSFVHDWLTSKAMAGKFAAGEYYDGNPNTLNWWVWQSGMSGRSCAFDFALHFVLQHMCNNGSRWDMSQLDHAGLAGISPLQAVTFVENPDTDTDGFTSVVWNKMLGYAYILTSEGYPCVYYRDYSADQGCYGLKPYIDNLIWIHENLAFGPTIQRWKDYQCFVFERQGYPNLLVGMNNDGYNGWRTVRVQTNFGPYVQLHDYTGRAGDVWTDWSGAVTIGIPPNDNGLGYVCYSRNGYGQTFSAMPLRTTQAFEGATDLDIGPALNGTSVQVGRIWCAAGSEVEAVFSADTGGWDAHAVTEIDLLDASGLILATGRHAAGAGDTTFRATASRSGWLTVRVRGVGLPASGTPFALTMTYSATQEVSLR
jgi:alpha-amylase